MLPDRLITSLMLLLPLQVFCGITSRVWQFSDILLDARKQQQQRQIQPQHHAQHDWGAQQQQEEQQQEEQQQRHTAEQQPASSSNPPPTVAAAASAAAAAVPCCQAILGDLNTMAHSLARLSPNYCRDAMRWRSLGSSEAAWWQRYVLAVMGEAQLFVF
jgi:hypothetical protein